MEENVKVALEVNELPTIKMDWPNERTLNQNKSLMEYVLVDDNYKTLHKPFFCKDYFNEIITTEIDGKERIQYGFKSEKMPIDLLKQNTFKMALLGVKGKNIFTNENEFPKRIINLLNEVEINRGYTLSTLELTSNEDQVVVTSDIRWMDTGVYISFYCLLIRLAYNYQGEYTFDEYINKIFSKIDSNNLIKNGEFMSYNGSQPFMQYLYEGGLVYQPWEDKLSTYLSTLHNDSGMYTFYNSTYQQDLEKIKKDAEKIKVNKVQTVSTIETSDSLAVEVEEGSKVASTSELSISS